MKMDEHLVDELTVYRVLVLSEALSDFDAAVTGYSLLCHLHEVSHSFHSPGATGIRWTARFWLCHDRPLN